MAKNYSEEYTETISDTGAKEAPFLLLEIDHRDLSEPLRLINDTQDIYSKGHLHKGLLFDARPLSEPESGKPQGALSVDNIGAPLVDWIEGSNGGEGATVRMMQVLRSNPNLFEFDITTDLSSVSMDTFKVNGSLGFEDTLNRPAVMLSYRPTVSPGLY